MQINWDTHLIWGEKIKIVVMSCYEVESMYITFNKFTH